MIRKDFAICFSGQVRELTRGFEDFKRLFENIDYDIFAHLWDCEELLSGWGHNMGWENIKTKIQNPNDFIELYKPQKIQVEEYIKTPFHKLTSENSGYRNPYNSYYSSLSQFYSLKSAFRIKNEYSSQSQTSYKYAIRYRPDLDIDFDASTIDWDYIKNQIDKNPNTIYVNPGWDWPDGHGCANMFAVGSSDSMDKYSLIYDNYPKIRQMNPYGSYDESNVKFHIEKFCGLKVDHCQIHVGMYR